MLIHEILHSLTECCPPGIIHSKGYLISLVDQCRYLQITNAGMKTCKFSFQRICLSGCHHKVGDSIIFNGKVCYRAE